MLSVGAELGTNEAEGLVLGNNEGISDGTKEGISDGTNEGILLGKSVGLGFLNRPMPRPLPSLPLGPFQINAIVTMMIATSETTAPKTLRSLFPLLLSTLLSASVRVSCSLLSSSFEFVCIVSVGSSDTAGVLPFISSCADGILLIGDLGDTEGNMYLLDIL